MLTLPDARASNSGATVVSAANASVGLKHVQPASESATIRVLKRPSMRASVTRFRAGAPLRDSVAIDARRIVAAQAGRSEHPRGRRIPIRLSRRNPRDPSDTEEVDARARMPHNLCPHSYRGAGIAGASFGIAPAGDRAPRAIHPQEPQESAVLSSTQLKVGTLVLYNGKPHRVATV